MGNGLNGDKFGIEVLNLYLDKFFWLGWLIDIFLNDFFFVEFWDNNGIWIILLDEVIVNNFICLNGFMII